MLALNKHIADGVRKSYVKLDYACVFFPSCPIFGHTLGKGPRNASNRRLGLKFGMLGWAVQNKT